MLITSLLQSALVAVVGLSEVATAAEAQAVIDAVGQESSVPKNPHEEWDIVEGRLMDDCAPTITACGRLDSVKIEYRAGSTQFIINNITEETVTTLKPETTTRTVWEVETVITENKGWCRNTTTFYDTHRVETVHLNATITTTREFIPIHTARVTSTSTVRAEAVDQCIIKDPTAWPVQTPPPGEEKPKPNKPREEGSIESPGPKKENVDNTKPKEEPKKGDAKPSVGTAEEKKKQKK